MQGKRRLFCIIFIICVEYFTKLKTVASWNEERAGRMFKLVIYFDSLPYKTKSAPWLTGMVSIIFQRCIAFASYLLSFKNGI